MNIAAAMLRATLASMLMASALAQDHVSPSVAAPPESFFNLVPESDRAAARSFYKKYVEVNQLPVAAAVEVADEALYRTREIISHLLAGRPDIRQAMVSNGMYLIIIGKDQRYTDMPEYRHSRNPEYLNERVRGTGGKPTSFGEENLLNLAIDRYDDESIGVHEFCHTIDGALRALDSDWSRRKTEVFQKAKARGLWKDTYAGSNAGEYWAEICQSYFDCNRINNWNHGPIGTRVQLQQYDPEGYQLVHQAFQLGPGQQWKYRPLQKQPSVIAPPARFRIDPYYTKFTWAREFPVVGRQAGDQALLAANDTIRKMFAYRHDILKALIADGARLIVLGQEERISDLPECKALKPDQRPDSRARRLDYHPECKLLVVGEEDLLSPSRSVVNPVIREFAKSFHQVTGARPVDSNWEKRGREVQQYELRVKRLDVQFDEKLKELHRAAVQQGLWAGTAGVTDRSEYWAQGVGAYFDALGQSRHAYAMTREQLKEYDPELFALVHETMAYEGKQDWRCSLPQTASK